MTIDLGACGRYLLAIILVSLPLSWVLWQWRTKEHEVLTNLSDEAFHQRFEATAAPAFLTYAVWITGVVLVVVVLVLLVQRLLHLLNRQIKAAKADRAPEASD